MNPKKSKQKDQEDDCPIDCDPGLKKPIDPKRVLQILEYRRKTMEFVESMLDNDITIERLRAGEEFICRRDYDSVVQERYLLKKCGYPVCQNVLTRQWNQKFHISFRDKKIYDVEIMKLYCSVKCMNASTGYRDQHVPEQPVWMRLEEVNLDPSIHLSIPKT